MNSRTAGDSLKAGAPVFLAARDGDGKDADTRPTSAMANQKTEDRFQKTEDRGQRTVIFAGAKRPVAGLPSIL
jgi:hypothetical protein